MVGQRRRKRATKQTEPQTNGSHQMKSASKMPSFLQACPRTNSGILVVPSLSRDPQLVQAMQEKLSNHSLLPRRCHKFKSKNNSKKIQKFLPVKTFRCGVYRKVAGKASITDSRPWRKGKPKSNPYMSGRSGHSLKNFLRSRDSSRSRQSYPSTWQLVEGSNQKDEKSNESKNSLAEVTNCTCLNRTPYDRRLNSPLKTDTGCQCKLKRRCEKAIQIPSTRIRSRSPCKLKGLKQLIPRPLCSVVAQQTQTSFKSNPQGKTSNLGTSSLRRYRAYSGEEDNKKSKSHNYGGYSPSETSVEERQSRPTERLSKIEKISKPPRRKHSGPVPQIPLKRMVDDEIRGPPWSLHLANLKEYQRYTTIVDHCNRACPKRCRCQSDDNFYDYTDYDTESSGNNSDDSHSPLIKSKRASEIERTQDGNIINLEDDLVIEGTKKSDRNGKNAAVEDDDLDQKNGLVEDDSIEKIDDALDKEHTKRASYEESTKMKRDKNVGFCPDVNCDRRCKHCSKIKRPSHCDCEGRGNSRHRRRNHHSPRGLCNCCQCSDTSFSSQYKRDRKVLCANPKCNRKCPHCREATTQTPEAGITDETAPAASQSSPDNQAKKRISISERRLSDSNSNDKVAKTSKSESNTDVSEENEESQHHSKKVSESPKTNASRKSQKIDENESLKRTETNRQSEGQSLKNNHSGISSRSKKNENEESQHPSQKSLKVNQSKNSRNKDGSPKTIEESNPKNESRRVRKNQQESPNSETEMLKTLKTNQSKNSRKIDKDGSPKTIEEPNPKNESRRIRKNQQESPNSETEMLKTLKTNQSKNYRKMDKDGSPKTIEEPNPKNETRLKKKNQQETANSETEIPKSLTTNSSSRRTSAEDQDSPRRSIPSRRSSAKSEKNSPSKNVSQVPSKTQSTYERKRTLKGSALNTSGGSKAARKLDDDASTSSKQNNNDNSESSDEPGEVPVHSQTYSNEDLRKTDKNMSVKKKCGDPNCKQKCTQCSEAVTQTGDNYYEEQNFRNYCCCAEAVTQTSYLDLCAMCCRGCGVPLVKNRCCWGHLKSYQRRYSGTEANTFNRGHSKVKKSLPSNWHYCTENHPSKNQFNIIPTQSRRSSVDRRYRQNDEHCSPNTTSRRKRHSFPNKIGQIYHGIDKCSNIPYNACRTSVDFHKPDSKCDLRDIIDILQKAVTGLEQQQCNHDQLPYHNGMNGGSDNPLPHRGSYIDFQQFQDTIPRMGRPFPRLFNRLNCAIQRRLPLYHQREESCPVSVYNSQQEHSKQPLADPNSDHSNHRKQYQDTHTETEANPEVPFPNYPVPSLNGQIPKNYDLSPGYLTEMSPHSDLNNEVQCAANHPALPRPHEKMKNQILASFAVNLPGKLSLQANTNVENLSHVSHDTKASAQGSKRKDSKRTNQDRNHTDQMSNQSTIYQSRKSHTAEIGSQVEPPSLTSKIPDSGTNLAKNINLNSNAENNDVLPFHNQEEIQQSQIPSFANLLFRGRRSSYPQSSHAPFRKDTFQKRDEEGPMLNQWLSNSQCKENHFDPGLFPDGRNLNTSQRFDDPQLQMWSAKDFAEEVRISHPKVKLSEAHLADSSMQRNTKNREYIKEDAAKDAYTNLESECNNEDKGNIETPCTQNTCHELGYWRVGFTDLRLPLDNKLRKRSGQSQDFLGGVDDRNRVNKMTLPISEKSNQTRNQIRWPRVQSVLQIKSSMVPHTKNSYLLKQSTQTTQQKKKRRNNNHSQANTVNSLNNKKFNQDCMPTIEPIWPQPRSVPRRVSMSSMINLNGKCAVNPFGPSQKPSNHELYTNEPFNLNCKCKNPSAAPRLKHYNSRGSLARLNSYDRNILRDFERQKKIKVQESSEESSSDSDSVCMETARESKCCCLDQSKDFKDPCSGQQLKKSSSFCPCCGKREQITKESEPKPSKVHFACCHKPKKEKKAVKPKSSKSIFPCCQKTEKEKKEPPKKVEPKPSKGLFPCCKKPKKEKKEVQPKPSRNLFACCNRPKKEKPEAPKKVESKPSRKLFACCKRKEKKEAPKDVEPKPSKGLFACCKKPKKEKKDVEPKPSRNLFACCKKPKKEKEETPKIVEPKPSKSPFFCCKKPKKEKEEAPKNVEPKPSKNFSFCCKIPENEKKEAPENVEPKPSKNFSFCCKIPAKEKKEAPTDYEPKPSRVAFTCCKIPSEEDEEAPRDYKPKPSKEKKDAPRKSKPKAPMSCMPCCKWREMNRGRPEPPPKPHRHRTPREPLFSCGTGSKREAKHKQVSYETKEKERQRKQVKVLFDCSCHFCSRSSSEEDSLKCYNPNTRLISNEEKHKYIPCDKRQSNPPDRCCRPQSTSSSECELTDSSSSSSDDDDEEDCGCQSANDFYSIFENQNPQYSQCNYKLPR